MDGNNRKIRSKNLDWDSDDDNVGNIKDCNVVYFSSWEATRSRRAGPDVGCCGIAMVATSC